MGTQKILASGIELASKLPQDFKSLQKGDETLQAFLDKTAGKIKISEGLLYKENPEGDQIVLPTSLRTKIMELGHAILMAGHKGRPELAMYVYRCCKLLPAL